MGPERLSNRMASLITDAEFAGLFRSFRLSAWRLEASSYKLDYEAAELQRFIAGEPTAPPEVSWWRPWFDKVRGWRLAAFAWTMFRSPLTNGGSTGRSRGIRRQERISGIFPGLARLSLASRFTITGSLTTPGSC